MATGGEMKTAVYYHTCISSISSPVVDFNHGFSILEEQLGTLEQSGLLAACDELYIGVSGGEANACAVAMMAPEKATVFENATDTCGELPTLCKLQQWLPGHEGWAVLYFHTKGVTYPGHEGWTRWRHCMERVVIWNWQKCIKDLEEGFDCTGAHWLTPQKYPGLMDTPYYGGTFWWANSDYLSILPKLSPNGPSRYEAEAWIGKAPRKIRAMDHEPHWPGRCAP